MHGHELQNVVFGSALNDDDAAAASATDVA